MLNRALMVLVLCLSVLCAFQVGMITEAGNYILMMHNSNILYANSVAELHNEVIKLKFGLKQ